MQTFWFLRYQIQNSLLWRRSSSGLFSPIWPSGNISANIWKYRTLSVVMKRFITLVAFRIFLVSALEIWHSSSMLQLVAFSLVEPRCDQPMRKSHSTVSSNAPNQTDRNSSTKFHWTYWHRAALSETTCPAGMAQFSKWYHEIVKQVTDLPWILFLKVSRLNFQVYFSDLTKGGKVAFHHGGRLPKGLHIFILFYTQWLILMIAH